jgi:uncharacterized repeat protein (TIGR04138 family)
LNISANAKAHKAMRRDPNAPLTTLAGWTTIIQKEMLLLYLHPLPRPFSYRTQLRIDARAYKPWLIWLLGGGLIALGAYSLRQPKEGFLTFGWSTISAGAGLLFLWLSGFLTTVRWTRNAPLEVGLIQSVKTMIPFPDMVTADAIEADGTVVEVTTFRVIVDRLLSEHGECEVLYYKRRHRHDRKDSGFGIAARPRLNQLGPGDRADHWTSLPTAERLQLQQIARKAHYSVDAVFFVFSALHAARRRNREGGKSGGAMPSTQELIQFVPQHANYMFRGRAAQVMSALSLRTGTDIGAIVAACVEAGKLTYSPGDDPEDFKRVDLLATLRQTRPQ